MKTKVLLIVVAFATGMLAIGADVAVSREWQNVDVKPFTGELGHKPRNQDEMMEHARSAVKLLGYPEAVQEGLLEKVKKNEGGSYLIIKGDYIPQMLSGKNEILTDLTVNLKNHKGPLPAIWFSFQWQGGTYVLVNPTLCYNWIRGDQNGNVKMRLPIAPEIVKGETPYNWKTIREEYRKMAHEFEPAVGTLIREEFEYIPPKNDEYVIEHEPIVGAFIMRNELAKGWGGYGEYLAWLRKGHDYNFIHGWSPGVGPYGMYSEGESSTSSYGWDEYKYGPQVGLKYIAGEWQWQVKIRFAWEYMSGHNDEGYSMSQDNEMLGLYTESIWRESEEFYWGLVGEAWFALDRDRTSTWSGDSPSRRNTVSAAIFGQWKLDEDWQSRLTLEGFHQTWDHLTGIRIAPELRWRETVMLSPWVSFFPFGISDVYEGVASVGDLTTIGFSPRIEFGKPIRDYHAKNNRDRVRSETKVWFDSLERP